MIALKKSYCVSFLCLLFLFNCNEEKKEQIDDSVDDIEDISESNDNATIKENTDQYGMTIKHKVADFAKWKSAYDEHASKRKEFGLDEMAILRSKDDSNTILVALKPSDITLAKDFSQQADLKDAMGNAGVVGMPEFSYYTIVRNENTDIDSQDRVIITHRVKDFDKWISGYDNEGIDTRLKEGMVDRVIARGYDDPNLVIVSFAITDMTKAKAAISSENKKKLMMDAGVEGAPTIEYYIMENN